jgi:[ribosomal protein S5]-alanine N-acetyltransferase
MDLIIETERLLLRQLLPSDAEAMFELDGNPNVHRYLGNEPVTSIEQVRGYIKAIRNQYITNGIGRFAVVLKETNEVIGWSGLKFITEYENNYINFYDIGYRIQEKHWKKGYALESAIAWLDYGFKVMKIPIMYGSAHVDNIGSNKILQKIGMNQNGQFYWRDLPCNWYELENNNVDL